MKDFNLSFIINYFPYCLKYRKKTESKNASFAKLNQRKTMLLSKNALCNSKKLRFIKEQDS